MEYLLFTTYLVLFAWLTTKVKFFTRSGLTPAQLTIVFLLKVMAGIFYGWIGVYYGELAQMVDTWMYHYEGVKEYQMLLQNPSEFASSLFRNTYEDGYSKFLSSHNSWWNDLKANFMIKIFALFNLLSFGHYYINVIIYSFVSLFGPIAIYRVMCDLFPAKKAAVLIGSLMIPSFLYWTSGLHKEGLIFAGLALVVYQLYFGFKEQKFRFYRLVLIIFGLLMVLALRNFLIIVLLPALVAWILSQRLRVRPVFVFSVVYFLFITLFFTAKYIHPKLDFPGAVMAKQQDFMQLHGNSSVAVDHLEPNVQSFVVNMPQAISLAALRPYPTDVHHLLSLAAALEISLILLLLLLFLLLRKRDSTVSPFLLFSMFFSISILLMIGYSVNNLGAIVRYRSIVFPFLLAPMVASIDWSRVNGIILRNIRLNNNI